MKKNYFTLLLIVFVSISAFAQTVVRKTTTYRALPTGHSGLNIGASFMLPVYELNDYASAGFSADINYLLPVAPLLNMGIASGYGVVYNDTDYLLDFYEKEDAQFIPIALATRYVPSAQIEFGADFGYAIGVSDQFNGGFYYKPMIGFNLNDMIQLNLSYTGVSNNSWITWSTLNFGFMFNVN
ncbi:hypothetical protein FNB79_12730 [Formosa sediminum]|uniref:Outer membrane protein beta-barrel domain-containing protein n=1 Tax=Formosa sediminum TaxID=2594004 RepID=A0A516GTD9_9FLAO|nr:hypothetical protein [Formosa sediminum]QDO94791.1 hypothetical protein FNB79_12730 [Formosa sediminum]